MTQWLRQGTAINVMIGPFIENATGSGVVTSLTINQANVRLSKNGGNFDQKNNSTACTNKTMGYYTCPLSTVDTDTVGRLVLTTSGLAGHLPVFHEYMVLASGVYDAIVSGGTNYLSTNVATIANDSITAAAINTDAVAEIQSGLATSGALNTVLSSVSGLATPADVWNYAISGYATSGSAGTFGREIELIRMILTNHQTDNGTTITIHNDNDEAIGSWTWIAADGDRSKLTGG